VARSGRRVGICRRLSWAGYGRALTEAEELVLLLLTARLGVSYLTTGIANDNPVLVERGRRGLAGLVNSF
jgi:hypothetical protein